MTFDASADADDFLELAVAAVYDGATAVEVNFDDEYAEGLGVAGRSPRAIGKASDFPESTAIGKTLLIGGTTYTIQNRKPLDDGLFVELELMS